MTASSEFKVDRKGKEATEEAVHLENLSSDLGAIVLRFMTRKMGEMWLDMGEPSVAESPNPGSAGPASAAIEKPHTYVQVTYLARVRAKLLNPLQRQAAENDLFLVDDDEIDEISTVNAMHSRAMARFRHRIEHLEARLDFVNSHEDSERIGLDSFLAESFCSSLQEALKDADFTNERRQLVYSAFGRVVIDSMGDMYDRLNRRLAEAGALPDLEKNKIHVDPRVYARELHGKQQDGAVNGRGSVWMKRTTAKARPKQVKSVFNAYIHGEAQGDAEDYPARGKSSPNIFSREELLDALSTMQMRMLYATENDRRLEDEFIINSLVEQMERRYIRKGDERLHVMDIRLIEFVGMMFDAFTDDPVISSVIVSQILRLQVPVIKAAMLDADVFVNEMNPVRNVLECIVEAGEDVYTQDDEVYLEIDSIIQELIRDYTDDLDVFEVAADTLKILVDCKSSKYDSSQRKARKGQLFTQARADVLKEVKAITRGKVINAKVKTLVLKHLPTLLTQRHVKRGMGSKGWEQAVALMDKVVRMIQPKHSDEEWRELEAEHADVLETLRWELLRSRQSPGAIESAIDGLGETFERLLQMRDMSSALPVEIAAAADAGVNEDLPASEMTPPVIVADEPATKVGEEPVAETVAVADEVSEVIEAAEPGESAEPVFTTSTDDDAVADDPQNRTTHIPDCVRPGIWFEVYDGEGRPVRRLKLSMVIDDEARLVFVNSRSIRVMEKDIDVFIRELDESKSRVYADSSAFESALGQVIHRLVA